jgi:beta-lactamase regulating signal transducer with metallopeptidase domain
MSLNGPVAEAVGWALLHLIWQGTVVAAILAAVLALLDRRSANARYVASCAALALLLILGVATGIRAYEPAAAIATNPIATSAVAAAPMTFTISDVPHTLLEISLGARLLAAARHALPNVVLIWLIGVALLSSRLLLTWLKTQRLARTAARAASDEWQRVVKRLAKAMQLRRAIRLVESAAVEVPAVIGLLRPIILLPASTLTGLAPRQIEMVLAHELAHIRRHDFFVNLLQAVVETLMFYHPAVWWMSHRVRIERENCCDDLAVAVCGDAIQYARALARLEELRAPEMAMAANGGSLLDRVRRIAGARAESIGLGSRWTAAVAMLAIVVLILTVPSLPALAQREDAPKKAAEAKEPKKAATTVEVSETHVTADATDVDENDDSDDVEIDTPAVPPVPPVPPAPMAPGTPAAIAPMAPLAPGQPAPPAPPALAMAMAADMEFEFETGNGHAPEQPLDGSRKLTVDELIHLRASGVTPEYINTMRELFPGLGVRSVSSLKAVGVTVDYVKQIRAAGLTIDSPRDATSLRATGVTPEFLRQMRDLGFEVTTAREATSLSAMHVTAEWVREMKDAGVTLKSAKDATRLRAVGVTADFVRRMAKAGYSNLSVNDLTRLAAAGVNEDFIREMDQYRKK